MAKVYICGTHAPSELVGNLGPMTCNREVSRTGHAGDHRAHKTIVGVGRINVLWKQSKHRAAPPPVITLPRLSADELQHLRADPR